MRTLGLALGIGCSLLFLGCSGKTSADKERGESEETETAEHAEKKAERKGKKKPRTPTSAAPGTSTTPAAGSTPVAPGAPTGALTPAAPTAPPAPPGAESFFAGPIPPGVTLKAIKASAIEDRALVFQPVEGWTGGKLPGNDYMAMSKDQSAVFRVVTSTAVVQKLGCADLATFVAMAPTKGKNVVEVTPGKLTAVGANKFAALEGTCAAESDKGPLEIHYVDIARVTGADDVWHYASILIFPKDAPTSLRDEALAWARSLELGGRNGYKL